MQKKILARDITLKRAYSPPSAQDGTRILIDRLWPRGVRKSDAAIDRWIKDIAPSTALRKWFGHDPARWQEFRRRYAAEIHDHADPMKCYASPCGGRGTWRWRMVRNDGPNRRRHGRGDRLWTRETQRSMGRHRNWSRELSVLRVRNRLFADAANWLAAATPVRKAA